MTRQSIVFPGQGSQEKGMGRELAETWADAMDLWKEAEKSSGAPLREIYWDGEDKDMAETRYLQPALTVVNVSLWGYFKGRLDAAAVAGHSLGEYSALCAAGVLSARDILKLVSLRGRLMSEAAAGGGDGRMAAVLKAPQETVEQLVRDAAEATGKTILVANYNTPAQFVVSGNGPAVDHVCAAAKGVKARAMALPVSGAFHSPLMNEAAAELSGVMKKMEWKTPTIPVWFNATAATEADPAAIAGIMDRQMTSSVFWTQIVTKQYEEGIRSFVELGPKGVLTKMVSQILKGREDVEVENVSGVQGSFPA